ncbi:vWA domain-containing protein [Catellatospora chokoriensis]|uniref:VWFA domain-containing protein n=1 Tax=Catellatospora chokoriensis TaxID=310353 RepID=A0A8J3K6A9_9ACTN|nr:vWA domain-containing protein [Catellatospora chokoriensis]GIF91500.1 hypothetical protein Cch02nite_49440 [Catellatospora chokoriensis]
MYTAEINRSHPACLLLLVDQSGSMVDSWAGAGTSLAQQLATAVNRLLDNAVMQCSKGDDRIYDYFEVGIIGYGTDVQPVLHGSSPAEPLLPVSRLARNPRRVDQVMRREPDGAGGVINVNVPIPVWLDPVHAGYTPMTEAITTARQLVEIWCSEHPQSFPPLVINVTDGESTDGDPRTAATELRATGTSDGDTLLFNVHLSSTKRNPLEFPDNNAGLDKLATTLFEMSSILPPAMLQAAASKGYPVAAGARGFLYNADATHMIDFLDIGTRAVTPTGLLELTSGPHTPR